MKKMERYDELELPEREDVRKKVLFALDKISLGYNHNQTVAALREEFGTSYTNYYSSIMKQTYNLLKGKFEEEVEMIKDKNMIRLEKILLEASKIGGLKGNELALKTVAEMNKFTGVYDTTVNVNLDNAEIQFNFGTAQITKEDNE